VLDKIGTEILAREEELGTLLAREAGKTKLEGIGEATRAVWWSNLKRHNDRFFQT